MGSGSSAVPPTVIETSTVSAAVPAVQPPAPPLTARWFVEGAALSSDGAAGDGDGSTWTAVPHAWHDALEAAYATKSLDGSPGDRARRGSSSERAAEGEDAALRLACRRRLYYANVREMTLKGPGMHVRRMRRTLTTVSMSADPFSNEVQTSTVHTTTDAFGSDVMTGNARLRRRESHASTVNALSVTTDGRIAAIGLRNGDAMAVSITTGAVVRTFDTVDSSILRVAHSPGGRHVALASADGTVHVFFGVGASDVDTAPTTHGTSIWDVWDHDDKCYGLAFTSDGRSLVTAAMDRSIKRYDVGTQKLTSDAPDAHTAAIYVAHLSARTPWLGWTSGDDGVIAALDFRAKATVAMKWNVPAFAGGEGGKSKNAHATVWSLHARYDDAQVASGSMDGAVCLWDVRATAAPTSVGFPHGRGVGIHTAKHLHDGSRLLTCGRDGFFRIVAFSEGREGGETEEEKKGGECAVSLSARAHGGAVYDAEFSLGAVVFTVGADRTTAVWDLS